MKQYYININEEQVGPLSFEEVLSKKINKKTKVWHEGLEDWIEANQVEEFSKTFQIVPPPIKKLVSPQEPPKIISNKIEDKLDLVENPKRILGVERNLFLRITVVLVILICVYFSVNKNNSTTEQLNVINFETESQIQEIDLQLHQNTYKRPIIAEQNYSLFMVRRKSLKNRLEFLENNLSILYPYLIAANKNLDNIHKFQFGRSLSEKKVQIEEAQSQIDYIDGIITKAAQERFMINEELDWTYN